MIETLGGMQHLNLTVTDGLVSNIRADIGEPRLNTRVIPVNTNLDQFVEQPVEVLDKTFHITAVSWGNPHCAMFVDSVADLDVERYGKTIEHMTSLFPSKPNVTFAEFVNVIISRSVSGSVEPARRSDVGQAVRQRLSQVF